MPYNDVGMWNVMIAMNEAQVLQCLTDAGCDDSLIERFEAMRRAASRGGQLALLNDHRRLLLDRIHAEQKKLDCLDYLLWSIKEDRKDFNNGRKTS